jgi:hypothetical protein
VSGKITTNPLPAYFYETHVSDCHSDAGYHSHPSRECRSRRVWLGHHCPRFWPDSAGQTRRGVDYPKTPVQPGQSGVIRATFNAAAVGAFNKSVSVESNAEGGTTTLYVKGEVIKADEKL